MRVSKVLLELRRMRDDDLLKLIREAEAERDRRIDADKKALGVMK